MILVIFEFEGLPEALAPPSRILDGDDLQGNVEELEVAGVGHGLKTGEGGLQIEPADVSRRGRGRWRRRGIGPTWRGRSALRPGAHGAFGESETPTEVTMSEAVLGAQSVASGDETVLRLAPPDALCPDEIGGDLEQRLAGGIDGRRRRRSAPSRSSSARGLVHQGLEAIEELALEPTDALGTDLALPGEIRDGPGDPGRLVVPHDGGGKESQECAWRRGAGLRGSERHRCSRSPGLA
jgi:hypothetical protein